MTVHVYYYLVLTTYILPCAEYIFIARYCSCLYLYCLHMCCPADPLCAALYRTRRTMCQTAAWVTCKWVATAATAATSGSDVWLLLLFIPPLPLPSHVRWNLATAHLTSLQPSFPSNPASIATTCLTLLQPT